MPYLCAENRCEFIKRLITKPGRESWRMQGVCRLAETLWCDLYNELIAAVCISMDYQVALGLSASQTLKKDAVVTALCGSNYIVKHFSRPR